MANQPEQIPAGYLRESVSELAETIRRLSAILNSETRVVDEYRVQTLTTDAESTLTVLPQFASFTEIIESIVITGPPGTSSEVTGSVAAGSVNAGTVIASLAVPQGTYMVNWSGKFTGTTGGAETNNFGLYLNGVLQLQSQNAQTSGTNYPQIPVEITVPAGGGTITMQAINNATATAGYSAQIVASTTSGGTPFTLQLGDRTWNLSLPPTGILTIAPVKLFLGRNSNRVLSSPVAGDWGLELMGRADVRNRP